MIDRHLAQARGFLFIGDVHLSSVRPGRRKDDYATAILGKISQAIAIANREDLIPVFEGDMFDDAKENNESLKTRLTRELCNSRHGCWSNVGNHDKKGDLLGDGDTLSLIAEAGWPLRVMRMGGPLATFMLNGVAVGLGFTPHGQEIPCDVRGMFPDAAVVVWVTHHDIAFEGTYPGGTAPFEIKGCAVAVNGHIHLEKRSVTVGDTSWFNFGSLGRTAIDAVDHAPSVWGLVPGAGGGLTRYPIEHERDAFDLTGKLIDEASPGEGPARGNDLESAFVALLEASRSNANPLASDGGGLLLEAITARLDKENAPVPLRAVILGLFNQALVEGKAEPG